MEGILLPIILLVVGAIAFFLEPFIPSYGLITITGAVCLIIAIVLAFKIDANTGTVFLVLSVILVPVCLVTAFVLLPRTPMGRRLMLLSSQQANEGYVAQDAKEKDLVGEKGVALSNLRPSGEARIGDGRYDVITEGEMIGRGAAIEVRHVSGNRIVVREIRAEKEPS
jgi:membrane-bound serine protease (ClpP class)